MFVLCYECGNIFPTENPFENESVFMSIKKRKYKNRRLNSLLDDDLDIAAEHKRHGSDNVRIIQ